MSWLQRHRAPIAHIVFIVAVALAFLWTPSSSHAGHTAICLRRSVTIYGTADPDVLIGTIGNDVIRGGRGDDSVFALSGRDRICGGEGDDSLEGDSGYDRIDGGPGHDTCSAEETAHC